MTSKDLIDLATRIATDLKNWSAEAAHRNFVTAEELEVLRGAAAIIERGTEKAALDTVNDTPERQQQLTGESVTAPEDTLGG